MTNPDYSPADPDLVAVTQGVILAVSLLIKAIAKHPGIDTALMLSDWQEDTAKLKKVTPQMNTPGAFAVLKQFEEMIRQEVRSPGSA